MLCQHSAKCQYYFSVQHVQGFWLAVCHHHPPLCMYCTDETVHLAWHHHEHVTSFQLQLLEVSDAPCQHPENVVIILMGIGDMGMMNVV